MGMQRQSSFADDSNERILLSSHTDSVRFGILDIMEQTRPDPPWSNDLSVAVHDVVCFELSPVYGSKTDTRFVMEITKLQSRPDNMPASDQEISPIISDTPTTETKKDQ